VIRRPTARHPQRGNGTLREATAALSRAGRNLILAGRRKESDDVRLESLTYSRGASMPFTPAERDACDRLARLALDEDLGSARAPAAPPPAQTSRGPPSSSPAPRASSPACPPPR